MLRSSAKAEEIWKKCDKIDGELFTMTYGSLVQQLIKDNSVDQTNAALDKMGYNIGTRLIDEYLAKTSHRCGDFKDISEGNNLMIFSHTSRDRQRIQDIPEYIPASYKLERRQQRFNDANLEFSLILDENPLSEFVEIPESLNGLWYSNIYCGVIRGALEMVNVQVECVWLQDILRGDSVNEIRIKWIKNLEEEAPINDE